jgi:hypothetical protein
MRIDLRDEHRRRIGRIFVDPALRPTRATVTGTGREVYLEWDVAIDDGGHLRRCVACGCPDLFREKVFPQVTGIVVVLAFALAVLGALGLATTPPMFVAMGIVFVLDVAILLFARRRLVCYRCRTSYHGLPIARYHRPWDRPTADHYPRRAAPAEDATPAAPAGSRRRARQRKKRSTRPVG